MTGNRMGGGGGGLCKLLQNLTSEASFNFFNYLLIRPTLSRITYEPKYDNLLLETKKLKLLVSSNFSSCCLKIYFFKLQLQIQDLKTTIKAF